MKNIIKRHPNLLAFLVYIFFGFCFFSYAFIKDTIILNGDTLYGYYPFKLYYSSFVQNGFSLWFPYMYLGMPMLGELQTALLYPISFIFFILPTPLAFNFDIILHCSLASFFTFLYLRAIGIRKIPSFLAGITFGFSGFLLTKIVYLSIQNAATWLPLILYFYEKIRQTLKHRYAIWAGIVIAVQILAGHFQISLYTYMLLAFFVLFYVGKIESGKRLKYIILSAYPILIGALITLPQLVSTLELSKYAWRVGQDYNFFSSTSLHPFSLLTLIFPFFFGLGYSGLLFNQKIDTSNLWAGWELYEFLCYSGVLTLILATFTSLRTKKVNKHINFWRLVCFLALLFAFGRYYPLYKLMYYVPVYNLFRVPARHLMEFCLGLSILFGIGLQDLIYNSNKNKKVYYSLSGFLAILACLITLFSCALQFIAKNSPPLLSSNPDSTMLNILLRCFNLANPTILIPICLLVVYAGAIFLLARQSQNINRTAISILCLVFLTDIFLFGTIYIEGCNKISKVDNMINNASMNYIKSHSSYNRNLFISNGVLPLYFIPKQIGALNGFDPLYLSDFGKLTDITFDNYADWNTLLSNNVMLSALNVKYISVSVLDYLKIKINLSAFSQTSNLPSINMVPVKLETGDYKNATSKSNEIILKSLNGNIARIRKIVKLKANTSYIISFSAKSSYKTPCVYCLVDNEGFNAFKNQWLLSVNPSEIKNSYKNYFKIISSGPNSGTTDLYISSYSKLPIYIKDIKMYELKDYSPPLLSNAESGNRPTKNVPVYKKVFSNNQTLVFENTNCLPKAYSVSEIQPVDNLDEIRKSFYLFKFNPGKTALLYKNDAQKIGQKKFTTGDVSVISYKPDNISVKAYFKGTGFVVLAEQFYPGWKAYIDGKEATIYPTNGISRGIVVPKGNHTIIYKYQPVNIYICSVFSGITVLICLLILLYLKNKNSSK